MSKQYEHIKQIRKEKYWLDDSRHKGNQNPLLKDLQQSINKLSRDLYRKDSHFLLELIQNAEDNDYDCDNPSLSFNLVKTDPTITNAYGGALVISNNEIGFSKDNMKAMCSIGSSFKEKLKGYIGEKGIGFKSVFKVTKSPYIYSNGYQVRFQDEIKEIGLGYIVPEWVESVPKVAIKDNTTIILPLNNGRIGFSEVSRMMREFTPETILFLNKIHQLRFSVEGEYDITISKNIENEHVVSLTISTSVDEQIMVIHKQHLLYTKNFSRPVNLLIEGREEVLDRDITISFPIGDTVNDGAVYAYLPVLENTGMPFILNADFLVPGSRDMIYEDSEWNEWLLHLVPELFVEAFTKFIRISKYRYELYRHIPITTKLKATYFEPVIKPIIDNLSKLPIIPTVPNGKFVVPSEAKMSRDFRKAISGQKLPRLLKEKLVTDEFQSTISSDIAKSLSIFGLTSPDVLACLNEEEWIRDIGYNGLIKVYRYLSSWRKNYDVEELRQCKILPIKEKKKIIFSCVDIQPIYLEATKHDIEVLKEKPSCIKVPVRFLDKQFYDLIKNEEELIEWLKEVLFVSPFSLESYAYDTTEWFKTNHNSLTEEQFVVTSNYILDHTSSDTRLDDFPILLSDGRRMLFSNGKSLDQELVTPAGLDPDSGWQLIFSSQDDRKHFLILSDLYIRDNEKIPKIVVFTKATRNPPLSRLTSYPMQDGRNSWKYSNKYSDTEKEILNKACHRSAVSRLCDVYVSRVPKPSGLCNDLSERTSIALIRWLNGRYKKYYHSSIAKDLMTEIGWHYYNLDLEYVESEMSSFLLNEAWLPSTKGLQKPSHVFKKNSGVYDVLGDTVPYFEHDLNEVISEYLGIRVELSNDELISYLLDLATSSEGSIQMAERIYFALSSREIDGEIKDQLIASDCIAIPKDSHDVIWVSPKVCVWEDRSDLFANEFYFLSKLYPKLKDFFIDVLDVASDIGDEQFCELWLDIQKREITSIKETEDKLCMLYNRLKPLFDSSDKISEEWWDRYLSQALLWSNSKKFLKPSQLYIPDDGTLKDVFSEEEVDYLWYPNGSSYSQWESLHSAFQVRSLKQSVSITLRNIGEHSLENPPKYITSSAKTSILTWLWEKRRDRFKPLTDKGIIPAFIDILEFKTKKLMIDYTLDDIIVEGTSDCYIDLSCTKLHYTQDANRITIAEEISRILSENDYDEHLELWVKGVLSSNEDELRSELKKNNWQIPDELRQLMSRSTTSTEKSDVGKSSTENDANNQSKKDKQYNDDNQTDQVEELNETDGSTGTSSEDSTQKQQKHRESNSGGSSYKSTGKGTKYQARSSEENGFENNYEVENTEDEVESELTFDDELFSCFNTKDKHIDDQDEWNDSYGISNDPIGRYEREYDRASEKHKNNRSQNDRYREVRRRILDGPDPLVRESLYRWYKGECQVCGSTFYQKNGKPFFISHFLVPRKVSDSMDMTGNSICLCADHFAQMVYGRIKSPDIIKQLESIDPANNNFELGLEINGEDVSIKYNQQHAIALKAFIEVHNSNRETN